MEKEKFEWELKVTWFFPEEEPVTVVVAQFVTQYDANVCAKALQSVCKNKKYFVVHK